MATRFYFSSTATPANSPGFAAWTRTTEALRRTMSPTKDGSISTPASFWAGSVAANATALCRQFQSIPMVVGTQFLTTATIKCQVQCRESGSNDNINRQPICVKIYNGTTLQATLVPLGHVGPNTTEWHTTLRNKTVADGDLLTGLGGTYTSVAGDYLVVELGGQVSASGGNTVVGTQAYGSDHATDLGENETDLTAFNPWIEFSTTIPFLTNYTLIAEAGSYVIAGPDADLKIGHVLPATAGSYVIAGSGVGLLAAHLIQPEAGAYAITGNSVAFGLPYILVVNAGSYAITGNPVSLLTGYVLPVTAGVYTIAGEDVGIWASDNDVTSSGGHGFIEEFIDLRDPRKADGTFWLDRKYAIGAFVEPPPDPTLWQSYHRTRYTEIYLPETITLEDLENGRLISPGTLTRPLPVRIPVLVQVDPKASPRTREHLDLVAKILNSLIMNGQLLRLPGETAGGVWRLGFKPDDQQDWAPGAPTTLEEALNRIAAALRALGQAP